MILLSSAPLVTQPVQIFLIVLVIILCAPLLLNRLKVPHIVGMIVAGIVVGPYGFNILDNDSSFAIFGQVGLLYLMFLAGLEIDMFHLRLNFRRGLLFGVLTLLIPLVLGVLSSHFILRRDLVTSLLLGSVYASHTLLSYPVAARFGITRTPAVLIAIVGTIIAVIGALLVLAATVNIHAAGTLEAGTMLWLIARLVIWSGALLLIYPRLTRYFFKHFPDKVLQYVFILTMVFLAAGTAQFIGLEAVLGAFLAGLILNRYVPAASPLMASIEFVGNALFIPYFLISVGMMINIRVIADTDTLLLAAIMLAVAMAGKWLPAWIAQRVNGLSSAGRGVIFGLTTAHTAVALAVVTLGYNMGILDGHILNATVLVILVTCAAAPIITAAYAPRLKLAMMEGAEETGDTVADTARNRINNTLIPVANVVTAQQLMDLALLMRNQRGTHRFYALHVRSDNSTASKTLSSSALEAAQRTAAAADIKINTLERYDLNIVTGLTNTIEERDITEIILGMHRRTTIIDSFLGMKVDQLLRATNKMVIVSRCYIPLSTITRVVVWVPQGAQFETGFSRWVRALARLTRQIGCRIVFCCPEAVQPLVRGVLYHENYGIRCEFRTTGGWDDFILMSANIAADDLLAVIAARPNSVSYTDGMAELPGFLQRYFSGNNLLIIYPEQFGQNVALTSFTDPLASDITTSAAPVWSRIRRRLSR